jgi:chaperonin GroES
VRNIRPIDDQVVIEKIETKKTAGGILLPDDAKGIPKKGRVLAVGPGRYPFGSGVRVPMTVKVGDLVHHAAHPGFDVTLSDGKEVLVIRESELLVIED